MDERTRLATLLRELKALGVAELFLDGLTAEEALALSRSEAPGEAAVGAPSRDTGPGPVRPWNPDAAEVRAFEGPPPDAGAAGDASEGAAGGAGGAGPSLPVLEAEARGCTRCRLAGGRTQVVFGRGSGEAELVVVGEAPGAEEDRTGLPFVGPAGKLLDLLLLSVGLDRERVYICNVLKCRPPSNRNPLPDEVETCAPYLHAQLESIAPKVLLAVGKFSAQMLTGREESIGRLRGQVHGYRGIPVVATYHPAYLLRSPHATRKTWQDLQLMRQVLDEHARR